MLSKILCDVNKPGIFITGMEASSLDLTVPYAVWCFGFFFWIIFFSYMFLSYQTLKDGRIRSRLEF